MRVKDKIAMFIGGGSDIATATAVKFIEEGATVILVDYDKSVFERVKDAYAGKEDKVREYVADARKYEEIEAAVEAAMKEFGRIDILVNCAGILIHKPIDVLTIQEWQDVIDINLTGIFNSCKAVTPGMKERKYGRIVNISSIGGRTGRPGVGVNYAAGVDAALKHVAVLGTATPTAVTLFGLAKGIGLDGSRAAEITVLTTLLSAVTIPMWIAFLGI